MREYSEQRRNGSMTHTKRHVVWQPYICQLSTIDIAKGMALNTLRGQKLRSADITRACAIADTFIQSLSHNVNRDAT